MFKELMADSLKNIATQIVKSIGQEIVAAAEKVEQQRQAKPEANEVAQEPVQPTTH